MAYNKKCIVPQCPNTSTNTPEKLFISVPKKANIRKKWLQLARRNPNDIAVKSSVFFCEDHFNIEKDIINFNEYQMGFSERLLIEDGVLPSKFGCQPDRSKRLCDASNSRGAYIKRQRLEIIQECMNKALENTTGTINQADNEIQEVVTLKTKESPQILHQDKGINTQSIKTAAKSVQVKSKVQYRSKAVQTVVAKRDVSVSPCRISTSSKFTSPFKITPSKEKPSKAGVVNINKKIVFPEKSDSDISYLAPPSTLTDSDTGATDVNADIEKIQSLKITLSHIAKKPLLYVGIPKNCYFLIQLINKHCNISVEHILMCLKKIRLNSTFSELEDNFGISLSYGSKLFAKNIPIIASVLRPFIVKINADLIKKNLPISFRHNYYNVTCIIDCLEIDIQKPSKALYQALTWSDYKKSNTIKYLISCTPNGLINYVSPGFGGRATDVTIIENCNFLDGLEPGTCILADRGFKNVDQLLSGKGIQLLRPPSVSSASKLSKTEVRQTKIIASLRIHIERVIRRVREFHMLKQHSVINSNILRVLDDVMVIACALVNIQDSLIK